MARKKKKRPFAPTDLRRLQFVSDPKIHPQGEQVVFVVRRADDGDDKNRYRSEIWRINARGGGLRRISAEDRDAEAPLWSPDGQQLLFLSKHGEDEKKQIYLLPADGGEAQRLTSIDTGVRWAEWSPDGRSIACLSDIDPRKKARSREARPLADDVQVIDTAFWQFNGLGSRIDKRHHLFVIPARGGRPRQLSDGPWSIGGPFPLSEPVCFGLDGQWLYYLATPDPADDWAAARRVEIFVIRRDGKERRQLTDFGGMFNAVRMSPAGELLAIGSLMEQGWASPNRLWSVDPETGTTRPVETGVDRSMGDAINCDVRFPGRQHEPWISSDGRRALVRVTDRAAVRLAEINLESGALSWSSPEDVSVLAFHSTPDGASRVELRTSMTELPELWVAAGDAPLRRLTKLNDRLLAQRQVFPGLPANVTASDGAQVEAWIQGAAQGKRPKRPLILAIHGGPKTVYGHAFMLEFQMLAGSGFAVLTSNPRGSDGYGTDWAAAVHAHYGERDYQDLMEVVDHALEADLGVDPQRLGVSGGSYGGFMTNWIVGHTDRFHAAVSQRGISNWESFFGTSDIGYFFSPEHIGALPWEDPGRYREKSPLTYAERIRTPLLIIHSEKDLRCPIEQAEQLFVYLKRLERDVRLARFPDESHELSRSGSPKRRMERLRLILSWFEERLAPGSRPG